MTQEASNQLIDKIKVILKGIDQTEIESEDGWWETSTGAKLGAEALKQILELLAQKQEPIAMLFGSLPVYDRTTPPQRTWVGLTRDEQSFVYSNLHNATSREDSFWVDFANAIEAKLKELNT